MSGLNPIYHKILEISTIITNINLKIIAVGPTLSIYQTNKTLSLMDFWNIKTHNNTGLLYRVKNSLLNEYISEIIILKFIKKWVKYKQSPICGNNIYQDRKFLSKYMPKLDNYLNFKLIDVNVFKELINRWFYKKTKFKKFYNHITIKDIKMSIKEFIFYKNKIFK